MDGHIIIDGIQCKARIGVSEQERAEFQRLEVNVRLYFSMDAAIHTDSLDLSIDYEGVVRSIQQAVSETECSLLETMAGRVAGLVLKDPRVERVEVEVRKFPKSLEQDVRWVAVHLERGHFR